MHIKRRGEAKACPQRTASSCARSTCGGTRSLWRRRTVRLRDSHCGTGPTRLVLGASSFCRLLRTASAVLRPLPFQMRFQVSSSEAPGLRRDGGGNRGNLQSTEGSRHLPRCPPHGPGAPVPALPGVFSTVFSRFFIHGSGTRSQIHVISTSRSNCRQFYQVVRTSERNEFPPTAFPYKSPRNLTTSFSRRTANSFNFHKSIPLLIPPESHLV